MPPAASEEANSDKMKLKRIRKERHARCFLKLLKEIAIKVVAEAEAFQDASEAFLVMKFEDMVLRAFKASKVTKLPISIAWK